jgi:uncharacterized RDD family membrane protein YckC
VEPKTAPRYDRRAADPTAPAYQPVAPIVETPADPSADQGNNQRAEKRATPETPSAGKPISPDRHVDTLVIDFAQAPEPPPFPEASTASVWVRTMAGACDAEIIATAYLPLFGAFAMMNTTVGPQSGLIMLLLLSAIVFVYQLVMLNFAGRTFGMALLNLHLVNSDDESLVISNRQKVLRALTATLVFICFPLHLVTQLSLSRRSLPDWVSGTTVAEL